MGNTVDGDDNLVLQCRTDGRMIPIVYGRQIVPAVAKQKKYGRPSRSLYQQTNHILLELSLKNK